MTDDKSVTLEAGGAVPYGVVRFVWGLEARGCRLYPDGPHLYVTHASRLTEDDRTQVRLWKPDIVKLLCDGSPWTL